MYGTDEHRAAIRRISVVARELGAQLEALNSLHTDLAQDDLATTRNAREYLRMAHWNTGHALQACDQAVAMLPTPASVQR